MGKLKRHVSSAHKRRGINAVCSKSFTDPDYVKRHLRVVHEKIKDHRCDRCGGAFGEADLLQTHVEGIHEGKKRDYLCKQCDRVFASLSRMRTHVKNAHKKK